MTVDLILPEALRRVRALEDEAHAILGRFESSRSRVVVLGSTYDQLTGMSLTQDDLIRQALRCIEFGLYRAAHVMAWAGAFSLLLEKLEEDGLVALRGARPKWKGADIHEMAEYYAESQFIEAAEAVKLCTKNMRKTLVSLLHRRNECAHPTAYYPGLNESLGYVSELLQIIKRLQARSSV